MEERARVQPCQVVEEEPTTEVGPVGVENVIEGGHYSGDIFQELEKIFGPPGAKRKEETAACPNKVG